MAEFFAYEHIKELVVYWVFGGVIGLDLYWIGYGIYAGAKWIIRKIKNKKEKNTNE